MCQFLNDSTPSMSSLIYSTFSQPQTWIPLQMMLRTWSQRKMLQHSAGMLGLEAWPRPRGRKTWPRPRGLWPRPCGFWPRPCGFWPRGLSRPTAEMERNVIGSKSITNSQKSLMPLRSQASLTLSVKTFIHKNIRQPNFRIFIGKVMLRKILKPHRHDYLPQLPVCLSF